MIRFDQLDTRPRSAASRQLLAACLPAWSLVLLLAGAPALAEPYREPATGLEFPDSIALAEGVSVALPRRAVTIFPDPAEGIAVSYAFDSEPVLRADVFIYDNGNRNIPDGVDSQQAHQECRILSDGNTFASAGITDVVFGAVDLNGKTHTLGGLAACYVPFSFVGPTGQHFDSVTYLTAWKGKIVKVRATHEHRFAVMANIGLASLLRVVGDQLQPR